MIYYLEPTEDNAWNIVGLPTDPKEESALHIQISNLSGLSNPLTPRINQLLDSLFSPCNALCWKSAADMDAFLLATKKHLAFRVKKHSVILPAAVFAFLPRNCQITPRSLDFALNKCGISSSMIQNHIQRQWR